MGEGNAAIKSGGRSSLGRYVFGSEISYNKAPPRPAPHPPLGPSPFMVQEPSHVKQLSPIHVCKIGLTSTPLYFVGIQTIYNAPRIALVD